jgi:hypothetical protein
MSRVIGFALSLVPAGLLFLAAALTHWHWLNVVAWVFIVLALCRLVLLVGVRKLTDLAKDKS